MEESEGLFSSPYGVEYGLAGLFLRAGTFWHVDERGKLEGHDGAPDISMCGLDDYVQDVS